MPGLQQRREALDPLVDPLRCLVAEREPGGGHADAGAARKEVLAADDRDTLRLGACGELRRVLALSEIEPDEVAAFGPAPRCALREAAPERLAALLG